jgi:hypothetical protein
VYGHKYVREMSESEYGSWKKGRSIEELAQVKRERYSNGPDYMERCELKKSVELMKEILAVYDIDIKIHNKRIA